MLFWILAGLAVFVMNNYLPGMLQIPSAGISTYVGSRDNLPKPGI